MVCLGAVMQNTKLRVIGAKVVCCIEGWQATIQYIDLEHDLHEEDFPLRVRRELAYEDVRRSAPDFPEHHDLYIPCTREAAE
jgi:hypothetical protein